MTKLKKWLCERFLPVWCREELLQENRRLQDSLREERSRNRELQAYIDGIHAALRTQRRITINTGEAVK